MNSPSRDEVKAWSCAALGVERNATPADLRTAALKLARDGDYAPPLDDAIAIGVALDRPRDAVEVFVNGAHYSREEDALAKAIDDFARNYFELTPTERRQRWNDLNRRTGPYPWWRARVDHLQTGLNVPKPLGEPGRMASLTMEWFVLSAGERAARRRELAAEMRLSSAEVRREMAEFAATHSDLASLSYDLFRDPGAEKRTAATTPRDRAAAGGAYSRQAPAPHAVDQPKQSGQSLWAVVVVIFIAIRVVTALPSCTPRTPRFDDVRPRPGENRNFDFKVPVQPKQEIWIDPQGDPAFLPAGDPPPPGWRRFDLREFKMPNKEP